MSETIKVLIKDTARQKWRAYTHLYCDESASALCDARIIPAELRTGTWSVREIGRTVWNEGRGRRHGSCWRCHQIAFATYKNADVPPPGKRGDNAPSLQNRPLAMWRRGYSDLQAFKIMTGAEYTGDVLIGTLAVPADQVREVVEARDEEAAQ